MNKQQRILTYLANLSFFIYFLLLLTERIVSIVLSLVNGVHLYGDAFNGYVYSLCFVSIAGFFVYLLLRCREHIVALFRFGEELDFRDLCIAGGILLLSGMVHTEYTLSVLQFISYGIWIVGILLQVNLNVHEAKSKVHLWLSFAYLVSFSMAIPVMYRTAIASHVAFHILEAIASILLVGVFTWFLLVVFDGGDNLFKPIPLLALIVLDVPIVAMRWNEEVNAFLLIFLCLSVAIYLADFIYGVIAKKKGSEE